MKNKKKILIVIIIILALFVVGLVLYKNRDNITVFSSNIADQTRIQEGMEVTLLGGTNMAENGAENSMRIYY